MSDYNLICAPCTSIFHVHQICCPSYYPFSTYLLSVTEQLKKNLDAVSLLDHVGLLEIRSWRELVCLSIVWSILPSLALGTLVSCRCSSPNPGRVSSSTVGQNKAELEGAVRLLAAASERRERDGERA
jgi:hypothetical protein